MGGMNASLMEIPCLANRINQIEEEFDRKYTTSILARPGTVDQPLRIRYLHQAESNPCEDLKRRKVKSMLFIGDSFARMAYQAMGSWLSNNYRNASIQPFAPPLVVNSPKRCDMKKNGMPIYDSPNPNYRFLPEVCDFEGAFNDGICRAEHYVLPHMKVCSGAVELVLRTRSAPAARPLPHDFKQHDVIIWGLGNHPSDSGDKRRGINNATLYTDDVLEPTCNCAPSPPFPDHTEKELPIYLDRWGKGDCVGKCEKKGNEEGESKEWRVCLKPNGSGTNVEAPCYDYASDGCTPWSPSMKRKVIWLQPHFRPQSSGHVDEQRPATDLYAKEMPAFVKHTCGVQHIVNPYSMTKDLVEYIEGLTRRLDPTVVLSHSVTDQAYCRPVGRVGRDSKVPGLGRFANCLGMHTGRSLGNIRAKIST
jgi:hypothetical protein